MTGLRAAIDARYGSHRGLVRLWLAQARDLSGTYRAYGAVDWPAVERLVFVCQGNVCRSPYAEVRARQATDKVVSLGLSTATGQAANPVAREVGARRGVDLGGHEATDIGDFPARDGDLFLVMEDRHFAPLQAALAGRLQAPPKIALLGLWATPRRPLIYDPIDRGAAYFETCFGIIDSAVERLLAEPGAASFTDAKCPAEASSR